MGRETPLALWYRSHGRHDLPWRATRDRWALLVSEVMLQQTQVARVLGAWSVFMARFPTPEVAAAGPGAMIVAWGRLGYPRRARRLSDAAAAIARDGWPSDYRTLPGVGRYTSAALAVLADDADVPAVEVNIRRVVERVRGQRLGTAAAEREMTAAARPLRGRDRLLALMDLGALVCRPRAPQCAACPLQPGCRTRGVLPDETRTRQARFEGSFRQRRGQVLARLREGPVAAAALDPEALAALAADDLAIVRGETASLP